MQERLTDDERRVVEANTGLVWFWINRVARDDSEDERQEMFADGVFGLMRAAQKFEPSMGNRFSTYAMFWIRQSIHRGRETRNGLEARRAAARGEGPPLAETSLDKPVGEELTLGDLLVSDADVEAQSLFEEHLAEIERFGERYDDVDRAIIREMTAAARVGERRTHPEVAAEVGMSVQAIRWRSDRLRSRLAHVVGL